MVLDQAEFSFDKFLKATGPNLMVRRAVSVSSKELKPVVQTFLFKGEGVNEIYDELKKHQKEEKIWERLN